jgi:hypothetical protein
MSAATKTESGSGLGTLVVLVVGLLALAVAGGGGGSSSRSDDCGQEVVWSTKARGVEWLLTCERREHIRKKRGFPPAAKVSITKTLQVGEPTRVGGSRIRWVFRPGDYADVQFAGGPDRGINFIETAYTKGYGRDSGRWETCAAASR